MKPARYTFTPELLKRFRRQGKPVLARDVDITDDIEHLARMGLDGIISDHPEALIKYRT
jgi:glycerophosphoryl diester phosphodiesterase